MNIKPIIVTCLNGRPKVSQIMLMCARRLNLPVVAGVTETEDILTVDAFDRTWAVQHKNVPGAKWNAALRYALEETDSTHFIIMGDDDSLSDAGMDKLFEAAADGIDYAGFKNNGYYELSTGKAMIHTYPHKANKLIGAGRIISRRALEFCCYAETVEIRRDLPKYPKGEHGTFHPKVAEYLKGYGYARAEIDATYIGLWPERAKSGLDHFSELRLVLSGFPPVALDDERIHVTDFKSEVNIWPYSILENACKECESNDVTWFLGDEEREYINSFKY